jgi:hydroxypyruvate isomerase
MVEAQGEYLKQYRAAIDTAAVNQVPNMVLLAGARSASLSDEKGADNAVAFCNQVKAQAEDKGITLCLENNNSKGVRSRKDSMFDHMAWGVNVIKRVNSPRVKILYDCFHAQLTEGNIVETIRTNIEYISHIHVGGVPGGNQPDENQELNINFIARAIADLNFKGYVSFEWTPLPGTDPIAGLKKVISLMTV